MKPSQIAVDFIKREEGLILHPYLDKAGVPTIGYGSTMYPNGKRVTIKDPAITKEYAEQILHWEVDNKSIAIAAAIGKALINQNQFDALVSLAYNIGIAGFSGSTVLKRVKANPKDPSIRDAFMMWNKITNPKTGKHEICEDLVERRKREADLYFKI